MVREKLDKRDLNLFGPNDFMAEEFNYRCTGWSKSQFCKSLMGQRSLSFSVCAHMRSSFLHSANTPCPGCPAVNGPGASQHNRAHVYFTFESG